MQSRNQLWVWNVLSGLCILFAIGLIVVYAGLPVDGGTGDLASFTEKGFRVQWLLEDRHRLVKGDIIVQADGHDVNEWLSGAQRGPEWHRGGIVVYEVVRIDKEGQPQRIAENIRLESIPIRAILARWGLQFAVAFAFLILGMFVAWRRSQDLAARVMMFFCVTAALQYVGDAYNFQYATIPWRWPFWLHLAYEYIMWGASIAAIAYFALLFPVVHPLIQRAPRLVPAVLFLALPVTVIPTIVLLAPDWNAALRRGSDVAWAVAMSQVALALLAGFRSIRVASDPIARAQVRWIFWSGVIGSAILLPGYVVPLLMDGSPLLPHPVTMLITALIPLSLAVAILRYRLFDIQVIVNRTLVYATLTVLLAGIYFLVVRVLSLVPTVWIGEDETLIVFVATMTVALAVEPLRRRTQHLIDLAFYRTKLDYQRLLPEMSERLATQVVLEDLAELLTYEVPARLQIRQAYLAVLDAGEKYFVPVGDEKGNLLPAEHEVVGYLQRSGKPLSYLQPPADLPLTAIEFLAAHQESALIIPLAIGGKLVGLYHLGLKRSGDAYTTDEVRQLHLLAQQAAIAVENSRLFQRTEHLFQAEREQRRLAQALQEAAAIVNRTLELDQVLARILEQVERVVPGDAFNIMLIEGDIARAVRWRGYERLGVEESISSIMFKIVDYPTLAYMQDTGQPIVIGDTRQDSRWMVRESWEWLRSYVSAPIQVGDQTMGFLNVDRTRPTSSGLEDGRRLEALAHHAATALEHARLYEQAQQELGERKWAEEKLKASLAEKEVLLQEIHHRVKNNLQVISSLLYLQSKSVHDPHVLAILQESRHRVRSMALVHEHLYQTEYPTHVDAAKYVQTLTNYLLRSYEVRADQIEVQVEVDDLRLGIDSAVPCGLLINELVSNALKHAFPDGQRGEIQVSLQAMANNDYRLIVGDDGIGLAGGLEGHNADSLGLRLVQTLTQQLEGVIELDTSAGTRFEIVFPASDMYKGG